MSITSSSGPAHPADVPHPPAAVRSGPTAVRVACAAALVAATLAACGGPGTSFPGSGSGAGQDPDGDGEITTADGLLEEPVSVDSILPAVTSLDADLLAAVHQAADDAGAEGIEVLITSGWRSVEYQEQLLAEAVAEYGSTEEAARWVASSTESRHVSGAAVDVGPTDAAYWMSRYGSRYGLCQTYANEIWHYELVTEPGGECPAPATDAAT